MCHDGESCALLELISPTPTSPTKARIRAVSHEHAATMVVKCVDLRPLASPRPVHMHAGIVASVGQFVFFSTKDSPHVHGGVVTSVVGSDLVVHEYRQAPSIKRRFTSLYINPTSGKYEARVKPPTSHLPVLVDVSADAVHACGSIDNYHISASLFDALRSLGVLDE